MIKVLIFDDNADRRDSLSLIVLTNPDFELVGACPDCSNVLADVERFKPDVVLMDIGMPGISGIEATKMIRSKFPGVKVLIQTVFEDEDKIYQAIRNGASGYLLKHSGSDKIAEAIKDVFEGGSPMTPRIAVKVLEFFRSVELMPESSDYGLSKRELEVLEHLVQGNSYKMIADALQISYNTVNSHMKKIYEKLHVNSVGEAVSKAITERIVRS